MPMHRRDLLCGAAAATAATVLSHHAAAQEATFRDRIKKAVKFHMIREDLSVADKLRLVRDLGFDGVEPRTTLRGDPGYDPAELARASEQLDVPVHGVVNSSHPDLEAAIGEAERLGASSVLHVVRYKREIPYLENYRETQEIIRRAIPVAERKEISILIENVWASFLIEPMGMAQYVDSLDSPFVQVYFDVGNVVRWGWPQHWIEVLGTRVKKLDIKEYDLSVAMNEGMRNGFNTPLGEGSVEWAKVRHELAAIDYHGWATAEVAGGDRERLADIAAQMDRVLNL